MSKCYIQKDNMDIRKLTDTTISTPTSDVVWILFVATYVLTLRREIKRNFFGKIVPIDHFANANFARSIPHSLVGLKVITRSNFGSLIQQKHCI